MDDYSIWNFVSIFFGLIFYGKLQRRFSRFVLGHAVVAAPREDVFMQCLSPNSSISVNSMRMLEPCPSGASRQRTLSEFLDPRPRESELENQLEDSVLVMPNGQDPWPEAQQLSSHYSPEHWGFRDSLESLVNTPGQEQVNVVETAAVGPERRPANSCTLCSAEDHDCIQADCHEGATRSSPIDWSPLRELSTSVRSMRQELQSVQGDLSGQAEQRARDQEIAASERESNRRQLEDLQGAVKELRDQQSQAHHSLDNAVKALRDKQSQANHDWDGAVEELRERYAHLNLVQNNEKRKVAWLTSRIDSVEDTIEEHR